MLNEIQKGSLVTCDGEGGTQFLVLDMWNSAIEIAVLFDLDLMEQHFGNEPLHKLHLIPSVTGKAALTAKKDELTYTLSVIDSLLEDLT